MTAESAHRLPEWGSALVVVAHPDDESFGLGGVLDTLVRSGTQVHVLCLTAGEASTHGSSPDLAQVRAAELDLAAAALGVRSTRLLHHPDGGLDERPREIEADVAAVVRELRPEGLVVFGAGNGVTGHPDHEAATQAALRVAASEGLPALEWCLPEEVAAMLNEEYGAAFAGFPAVDLPIVLTVDRGRQRTAVAAHASQAVPGSVLWRRLDLLGDHEYLRLSLPL
ncbi:MAG: PIG-L family deacetylase [Intrasporangiaceae bacterium]|jgi:LmbE family N-acetylglucosaminyl deacetylase|nr:PIG-L family deacetylase [Intrasporangiaceae bacterium]